MSAPSIPNLLSQRGSRGGGGGGGRGRFASRRGGGGGGGPGITGGAGAAQHDATIQGTDTDAAVSRLSAVELGYLDDPFARFFVQSEPGLSSRRLPIINRGTYTRTAGLDTLIDRFLAAPQGSPQPSASRERQIISLGAGTDTRALRLFARPGVAGLTYHEIDFPVTCARKLNLVRATPAMARLLPDPTVGEDGCWSCEAAGAAGGCRYWCHGLDLRHLASLSSPSQDRRGKAGGDGSDTTSPPPAEATPETTTKPRTTIPGLRTDIPTLLVSECCLCYLETSSARDVVSWFVSRLSASPALGMLLYEPTRPDDAFGRTMTSNLAARRIRMPTLEAYRSPEDQEARLREAGFGSAAHLTIDRVWERWVSPCEKERVDALQGLDEVEEWNLLAGHYVVAWGWRGEGFEGWEGLAT